MILHINLKKPAPNKKRIKKAGIDSFQCILYDIGVETSNYQRDRIGE